MIAQTEQYEIIGKAEADVGFGQKQWALKMIRRSDQPLPWWISEEGLEWPSDEETFRVVSVGDLVEVSVKLIGHQNG